MKKSFVITTVFMICLTLLASGVYIDAQVKTLKRPQVKTIKGQKFQLSLKTDLRVDIIHASRCKCDLRDVGAFYMSNIMVDVSNHKAGGFGATTESIIKVTYFDMLQGKMVVVNKTIPKMNPYPKNPWTYQRFVVVNHPVLVKASVGIKAEIKPKASNISDPVPANNVKKIHKCQVMVY
jgi:hypothetical protein